MDSVVERFAEEFFQLLLDLFHSGRPTHEYDLSVGFEVFGYEFCLFDDFKHDLNASFKYFFADLVKLVFRNVELEIFVFKDVFDR